jgi:Flp pilus assembly CpaE family ATPase
LGRGQGRDLGAVHRIVDALGRRQLRRADRIEPGQHVLPYRQTRGLGGSVDMVESRARRIRAVFVVGQALADAPLPLAAVERLETRIGAGGGLTEFSFTLIAGAPGSGKTTLAHQIMFALANPSGARCSSPCWASRR